ncbi:MAG: carbohydrate ABC transporter permease [Planctomycetales bacterium]|nr:carbohydrate ABC transporter permease [Planctomycetales bacterium]
MNALRPPKLAGWIAAGVSAVFAAPLVWMTLASLKSPEQTIADPYSWLPTQWHWSNYREATEQMPFWRYLANSLTLCVGSVAGTLISCTCAAYAFARLRWPGRDLAFAALIATMLLPWQATMVPRFLLLRELGLYDSLAALIVPKFFAEGFYVFLLRQYFLATPVELIEAARLDGCSELGVLWRIMTPLATPALAAVALLEFTSAWNDYGGPLLYLSDPDGFPLAYGLERFVSAHSSEPHLLMAAAVLFTLPVASGFLWAQRRMARGAASGWAGTPLS